jgi:polyhydroxyalkanoate synthesis regulator phasin
MAQNPERSEQDNFQQDTPDPLRQQVDELLINARNEAIIQTANLYLFGQKALRAGLGFGMLTLEAGQELLQRAVERGEIAESDAQAVLRRMQEDRLSKTESSQAEGASLTDRAAVALADSTSTILKALHLRKNSD